MSFVHSVRACVECQIVAQTGRARQERIRTRFPLYAVLCITSLALSCLGPRRKSEKEAGSLSHHNSQGKEEIKSPSPPPGSGQHYIKAFPCICSTFTFEWPLFSWSQSDPNANRLLEAPLTVIVQRNGAERVCSLLERLQSPRISIDLRFGQILYSHASKFEWTRSP